MQSDQAWREWGKREPYYGVLSDHRYRKENLADNLEAFRSSGETHWRMILSNLYRLYGARSLHVAVDFGCGVGRVLEPMSNNVKRAVGIDISPDMLAEAARNCPRAELVLGDDTLSRLSGPVDLVHSYIVLQHIPARRGVRFVDILLKQLAPGGLAALHLTVKRPSNASKRLVYFSKHWIPGARLFFNIIQGKPLSEPLMQMNEYDLPAVLKIFEENKMRDIFLRPVDTGGTFGVLIFARKTDD